MLVTLCARHGLMSAPSGSRRHIPPTACPYLDQAAAAVSALRLRTGAWAIVSGCRCAATGERRRGCRRRAGAHEKLVCESRATRSGVICKAVLLDVLADGA